MVIPKQTFSDNESLITFSESEITEAIQKGELVVPSYVWGIEVVPERRFKIVVEGEAIKLIDDQGNVLMVGKS